MNQQRSALLKHTVKCFSCLPLSLNRHWSNIWSMTVCWMLDQPSIRCRLNSSTSHTEF